MGKIIMRLYLPEPKVRKRAAKAVQTHRDKTRYTRKCKHRPPLSAACAAGKSLRGRSGRAGLSRKPCGTNPLTKEGSFMKRAVCLFVFAAFFALPALAAAEGIGVYVAPRFLVGFQDTGEISGGGSLLEQHSSVVVGGALAVGYNLAPKFSIPIRAELEYGLRTNSEGEKKDDFTGRKYTHKMNLSTLFLNAYYDIGTGTAFTPFVGLGVGAAFSWDGTTYKETGSATESWSDNTTTFAANVGVGVSYAFTSSIAADLGYRFIYVTEREDVKSSPYINEVYLGARITF
jgi:opacity protein-like surface antigen